MVIGVHRLRALPCVQICGGELSPRLGLARQVLRLMVTATWLEIKCSSEVGDAVTNGRERMASVNGVLNDNTTGTELVEVIRVAVERTVRTAFALL